MTETKKPNNSLEREKEGHMAQRPSSLTPTLLLAKEKEKSEDSAPAKVQPKVDPSTGLSHNGMVFGLTVVICATTCFNVSALVVALSTVVNCVNHFFDTWGAAGFPSIF